MSDITSQVAVPGYVAGTWSIDPIHSEVGFVVRHMMISKVRGRFADVDGQIVTGDNPADSTVTATIDLASVDTGNKQRDDHLRSPDFFDTAQHPSMTYRSSGVRVVGDEFVVDGELTIKGTTRQVLLRVRDISIGPDAYGGIRAGLSATGEINRHDFGVSFNPAMETGGVIVGDKVTIQLEIQAVLQN